MNFNKKIPDFVWSITASSLFVFMCGVTYQTVKAGDLKLTIADAKIETSRSQLKIVGEVNQLKEKNDRLESLTTKISSNQEIIRSRESELSDLLNKHNNLLSVCSPTAPKVDLNNSSVIDNSIEQELNEIQKELKETDRELTEEIESLTNENQILDPSFPDGSLRDS